MLQLHKILYLNCVIEQFYMKTTLPGYQRQSAAHWCPRRGTIARLNATTDDGLRHTWAVPSANEQSTFCGSKAYNSVQCDNNVIRLLKTEIIYLTSTVKNSYNINIIER